MIKNKNIYVVMIALSLISTASYSSYGYFSDRSVNSTNNISIVELDSETTELDLIEAKIEGNLLKLNFSKKIFYTNENILEGLTGDNDILRDSEIIIKDKSIIIKKINGDWSIPETIKEKNLPRISIENFEDRFGKKIAPKDIYFYKNSDFNTNGNLDYIVTNKGSVTDGIKAGAISVGSSSIVGINSIAKIVYENSELDKVEMNITAESNRLYEEEANGKKIKIIPSETTEEYSEWVDDTLQIYLIYGKTYSESDLQTVINNTVNINLQRLKVHKFNISNIKLDFKDENQTIISDVTVNPAEGIFENGKNSIDGKNTMGNIIAKTPSSTGRFKISITDKYGMKIEETALAIQGESPVDIINKIKSTVLENIDANKYRVLIKDNNTKIDITSKIYEDTGLNIILENK